MKSPVKTASAPIQSGHAAFAYSSATLQQIAHDVLSHAQKIGATACEADVSEGMGLSVTVRQGAVETIEHNRDKGLGVTVYLGQHRGHASSADFSAAAIKAAVEAALAIARHTAADPCAGLADAHLLAKAPMELDLHHPWRLTVEDAIELARSSEAAAFQVSPQIDNSEGASVSAQEAHFVSVNSLGFVGGFASSRHFVSCAPIARARQGGDMQRDDWYSGARDPRDLAPAQFIGAYAAERALARLGARKLKTCKAPVLFEAPLAAGLIGSFVHAISGGSLYRKASFLLDSLGQQVFPDFVHIDEEPHLKKGLASSPFDDDGVATHARRVVVGGVVQGYFLSAYSARKLGMKTTGNAGGSHNLQVRSSRHDLNFRGLLKEMGRGLLVTELLGQGVNYVTGDYSRGAAGYWVDGGEIQYPVHEITIAGNLRDMLASIAAIGNDVVVRGSKQVGSVLIEQMTVAGN